MQKDSYSKIRSKNKWIPPRSPYGLIQEDLFPDVWKVLVSCMLLNCTTRNQVEKILPEFIKRWPTPQDFDCADVEDVIKLCKSLGFANRRTKNLKEMTKYYLTTSWSHASELPGIGKYGARAWEIFCNGNLGEVPPEDHALVQYFMWAKKHEKEIRANS